MTMILPPKVCRLLLLLLLLAASKTWSFRLPPPPGSSSFSRTAIRHSDATPLGMVATKTGGDSNSDPGMFFARSLEEIGEVEQRRALGSQELLMLPRQYGPNPDNRFPHMNHVSAAVLTATPSESVLRRAVEQVMEAHPLLRCHVEGEGEPEERIDLFQMVRRGEPDPCTFVSPAKSPFVSSDVLSIIDVVGGRDRESLDDSWQKAFRRNLDDGEWCDVAGGPLWKLELHRLGSGNSRAAAGEEDSPCALVLTFNHAISDQSTANMLTDHILANIAAMDEGRDVKGTARLEMPVALEDSVLGPHRRFSDIQTGGFSPNTVQYVLGKAAEGFKSPVILPDTEANKKAEDGGGLLGALTIISGKAAGGENEESKERQSRVQFRKLSKEVMSSLLAKCRANDVTVSHALTAAATLTATDFVGGGGGGETKSRNYKVLQSLDMRRFGQKVDQFETVACMAGSMDLMHGPLKDKSGEKLRRSPTKGRLDAFWTLAREGKDQTAAFLSSGKAEEAVRVFDFAMTISDMNNLVDLTAKSSDSQGRAYSAAVTNVGVYDRQKAVRREGEEERETLKTKHGRFEIDGFFCATSHSRTGCLYPVTCMTVGEELMCTFHPSSVVGDDDVNAEFADAFVDVLTTVSGVKDDGVAMSETPTGLGEILDSVPENLLTTAAAVVGLAAVATHAQGFSDFSHSVAEMKQNTLDNPEDFSAALNFWIFFAVGHVLLQPILWISDVLHGSPGPKVADLVPLTFLAGNAVAIAAVARFKDLRNAVNVLALFTFFAYVGAGLEGQAGLGDYNLALDDPYVPGQIVKGCPAYDEVRQQSMDGFDIKKYQGKWYEHKFHDWTQFKEVYDTTLSIKLTADGKGWIDDFAVKGPAPDAAPLSWDKSPVGNGAHYFLFGRVDEKDPPGVLRESGFGVEFPNYIVDVKKDPTTGEYKEAIQFQCLERGGVRVFEGINFLSRNPEMSEQELAAMHSRAKAANMYPYGAAPEQMHTVARRPMDAPELDNSWQRMWKAIGVDQLLELLTESIEDGGR